MGRIERLVEREKQRCLWPADPEFPEGFTEDGRIPVKELYKAFARLEKEFGWIKEVVYVQELATENGILKFPIEVYRTPLWGQCPWYIYGIHGEESAGPNALAQNIEVLAELGRRIPVVVFSLCNPSGYFTNSRFPPGRETSVGDCDWLLPALDTFPLQPRQRLWTSPEAYYLPLKMLKLIKKYPPVMVFDHHEDHDEEKRGCYSYSQGCLGADDPVAKEIISISKRHGFPIIKDGPTELEGKIVQIKGGIVVDKVCDGSLDEFLAAEEIVPYGELQKKVPARGVYTLETSVHNASLRQRVAFHAEAIHNYPRYWEMANMLR